MKTLFAKILLWFLATAFVAVLGFVIVVARVGSSPRRAYDPLLRSLRFLGGEAVHVYEEGGRAALADQLARMEAAQELRGVLTDQEGRTLSGPSDDLSSLVERARTRRVFPDFSRRALVFSTAVEGREARYWFFLLLPRERFGFWPRFRQALSPGHLWVLGVIALLSFALAHHLTRPVLELRSAAERLGRGDFSARVNPTRRDELGELARTFDSMADRIERSVAAQKQLLQDVSHELRSPLSRLAVAVELVRAGKDPASALDRVSREADRLNTLVGELLALSRDQLRPSPLNPSALLAGLVEELEIEAQARRCRLVLDAEPGLELSADEELLRRAVENVARNAIYFTAPDTEVRIAARRAGDGVEIAVQDAGPGVPEDSLPRLFDAFYRVDRDRDRATGGAGLGLSIARRAVELHGGRIAARNTHPGLCVTLSLPAARVIMKG